LLLTSGGIVGGMRNIRCGVIGQTSVSAFGTEKSFSGVFRVSDTRKESENDGAVWKLSEGDIDGRTTGLIGV